MWPSETYFYAQPYAMSIRGEDHHSPLMPNLPKRRKEFSAECLSLELHILEVPALILFPKTSYPKWGSCYFQSHQTCWGSTFRKDSDASFQIISNSLFTVILSFKDI
jgi:hypothetical protein